MYTKQNIISTVTPNPKLNIKRHNTIHTQMAINSPRLASKADVAARNRCFSPPPSHHLSLTICLAAKAALHSNCPSTTAILTWLHTCAASARRNDATPACCALALCESFSYCTPLLFDNHYFILLFLRGGVVRRYCCCG